MFQGYRSIEMCVIFSNLKKNELEIKKKLHMPKDINPTHACLIPRFVLITSFQMTPYHRIEEIYYSIEPFKIT